MVSDRLGDAIAAEEQAIRRVRATGDAFDAARDQLRRCESETNAALRGATRQPDHSVRLEEASD